MSPGSSSGTSVCRTGSTAAAGSISHTARGFDSIFTKSGRLVVPLAPFPTSCCTTSAWVSFTTQWWPAFIRRSTMFAPMRPSPIIPSSIAALPADQCVAPVAHRVTAPVVKPNCSATTSIGADIPKVRIPRMMPEAPASRCHPSRTLIRAVTLGGRTPVGYAASDRRNRRTNVISCERDLRYR